MRLKKQKVLKQRKKQLLKNKNRHVFIGLGNPGISYRNTRHNAGFLVLESAARKLGLQWKQPLFRNYSFAKTEINNTIIYLVKPLTYMNKSGLVLKGLKKILDGAELTIICDNMDLPYGTCRIKKSGFVSGHNGIKSIAEYLQSDHFKRIYIGVSRPVQGNDIVSHVLGVPADEEMPLFEMGIEKGAGALEALVRKDIQSAMNEFNRRTAD